MKSINLLMNEIQKIDTQHVIEYNKKAKEEHKLHLEMGPSPFEGDIEKCPIVLLLANPGYDKNSDIGDHYFKIDGWPLAGIHEAAPPGMREWWRPRLKSLMQKYGEKYISNKIAALQINPWASINFDSNLNLPSQKLLLRIAEQATQRGAILFVMRAERLWMQSEILHNYHNKHKTRSPRCSYITEKNVGAEAWKKVNEALSTTQ